MTTAPPEDFRTTTDAERADVEARTDRAPVPSWQHPPATAERTAAEAFLDSMSRDEMHSALFYLSGYSPEGFAAALECIREGRNG